VLLATEGLTLGEFLCGPASGAMTGLALPVAGGEVT